MGPFQLKYHSVLCKRTVSMLNALLLQKAARDSGQAALCPSQGCSSENTAGFPQPCAHPRGAVQRTLLGSLSPVPVPGVQFREHSWALPALCLPQDIAGVSAHSPRSHHTHTGDWHCHTGPLPHTRGFAHAGYSLPAPRLGSERKTAGQWDEGCPAPAREAGRGDAVRAAKH